MILAAEQGGLLETNNVFSTDETWKFVKETEIFPTSVRVSSPGRVGATGSLENHLQPSQFTIRVGWLVPTHGADTIFYIPLKHTPHTRKEH